MSNSRIIILFLLYAGFSGLSCMNSGDEPIIILSVDREFSLNLRENLQSTTPVALEIHLESIKEQDCLNKIIQTNYSKHGNDLTVTISDILDPETCDPGNGPALGLELIDDIEEGSYDLMIELQEVVSNVGKLIVDQNTFKIEMNNEVGIKWQNKLLSRIPKTALWGYITYETGGQSGVATDFINTLLDKGDTFDQTDGYFGHFTIESSEIIAVNKTTTDLNTRLFIQYYEGSLVELDEMVDDFRRTAPAEMVLQLFDGKGNEW